jgi:uncharacterized protein with PIN domain
MNITHGQGDAKKGEMRRIKAEYLGSVTKDGIKSLWKCKKCDSVVIRGFFTAFKRHVDTVHETKPITCDKCGTSFNTTGNFKTHMKKVHKFKIQDIKVFKEDDPLDILVRELFEDVIDEKTGKSVAKCKSCDKVIRKVYGKKDHAKTHFNENNRCIYCGAVYKSGEELAHHILDSHDDPTIPSVLITDEDNDYNDHNDILEPKVNINELVDIQPDDDCMLDSSIEEAAILAPEDIKKEEPIPQDLDPHLEQLEGIKNEEEDLVEDLDQYHNQLEHQTEDNFHEKGKDCARSGLQDISYNEELDVDYIIDEPHEHEHEPKPIVDMIKEESPEPEVPSSLVEDSPETTTQQRKRYGGKKLQGITKQTLLKVPECLLEEVNKWLELMPDTWQCCLCNFFCGRHHKDNGQKHVANQHLTCDLCKQPLANESYSAHMETVHDIKLKKECLVRTKENSPISQLIQVSDGKLQMYKCKQCNDFQPVKYMYKIKEHVVTKHLQPKTYSCDLCYKTFWKLSEYDKHVKTVEHSESGLPINKSKHSKYRYVSIVTLSTLTTELRGHWHYRVIPLPFD